VFEGFKRFFSQYWSKLQCFSWLTLLFFEIQNGADHVKSYCYVFIYPVGIGAHARHDLWCLAWYSLVSLVHDVCSNVMTWTSSRISVPSQRRATLWTSSSPSLTSSTSGRAPDDGSVASSSDSLRELSLYFVHDCIICRLHSVTGSQSVKKQ